MTADKYIEEPVHEPGHTCRMEFATSDHVMQIIPFSPETSLLSARDLEKEFTGWRD